MAYRILISTGQKNARDGVVNIIVVIWPLPCTHNKELISHQIIKMNSALTVKGKVEIFPQLGGWVFVRVPKKYTEMTRHWAERGLVAITATVGKSSWNTSLLPMGDGTHFIALNAKVRKTQGIKVGDAVTIRFHLRNR